jgi:phytoene dehydrogenase-like protein
LSNYDVVIIGAGHNGLVAAGLLAKAGRRVLVLEKRAEAGGAALTEELFPGYRFSTCAEGAGYLAPEVLRELRIDTEQLGIVRPDPVIFAPQPDGSQLTIFRDTARTAAEIARFSRKDAEAYPAFIALLDRIAEVVGGLARTIPPDLPELGLTDLRRMLPMAGPLRRLGRKRVNELLRVLPMPVADLLDEWFESEVLKATIAANGIRDITWGPKEAGTAYALLYGWSLAGSGLFREVSYARGGIGSVMAALAAAARGFGAEIRTNTAVARVNVENERATGVLLMNGETIPAPVVVSNAPPNTTFLELLDPRQSSTTFVRHVQNIKYRGSAARVHLALRELPEFTAQRDGEAASALGGAIQIAPSTAYLQRAYDCVKYGEFSPRPYLDIAIPTLSDPDLAPPGHHVMSITAKYAPHQLRDADWSSRRDAFTEAVLETLADYAPKIRDAIVHQRTLAPPDLEEAFGLPEGSPHHGDMTLDQFFYMRPVPGHARYRAQVAGLYLCGAGTHPGGGVTGIPGRNAAREILRDGAR